MKNKQNNQIDMGKKLTLLINSCDSYSDLWGPFFTLLKKYKNSIDVDIVLNTETKDFSFPGLDIICIHPKNRNAHYGERILNCLNHINTPYTLLLLDDFFLRKPLDTSQIEKCIEAMDMDRRIVCFSCDISDTYENFEVDKYPGFKRIPQGSPYTLNLQGGIWRTKKLKSYWRPSISPWEWEEYCNLLTTFHPQDKFYVCYNNDYRYCDYGYNGLWMGVYHGKWVIEDVEPLFLKEGIRIDFSKRGIYKYSEGLVHIVDESKMDETDIIKRCLGKRGIIGRFFFNRFYNIITIIYEPFAGNYLSFLKYRAQVKFCKKHNSKYVHVVTKRELAKKFLNKIFKK